MTVLELRGVSKTYGQGVAESSSGGGGLELVLGLVALVVAVILLAPLCLAGLARLATGHARARLSRPSASGC